MEQTIPQVQNGIQLIGSNELKWNTAKEVHLPGPHQILARVEAVGLCFSDLKLLKQFDKHVRKSQVISGIEKVVLEEIPSYRPGLEPVVPGHEAFCTIVAVGEKVERHRAGQRVLVQTDYRWLKTVESNAAFGYNFEGGLQQYVLMDERVIIDPVCDESFLVPVEKDISSSSIALVEPWACVESSYITEERNTILSGGKLLVVADSGRAIEGLQGGFSAEGEPISIVAVCSDADQIGSLESLGIEMTLAQTVSELPDEAFDDIVCFGSEKDTIDILNDKLAAKGIINIVLGGQEIGQDVSVGVGRIHYGLTRWVGTVGNNAEESYQTIPTTGELRKSEKVLVVGAAGPMGQMHVIRLICSGMDGISIIGTDFDDERLDSLREKANVLAKERNVEIAIVNPQKNPLTEKFSYFAIMAPVGPLVAQAVKDSMEGTLINIFAGISASIKQDMDLDTYISNKCFMFGTSGSRLSDMKIVLEKVLSGQLDTDCSVDAISGMAGAIEGIRAVEARVMAGKIIVYPQLKKLPLTPLSQLKKTYPSVAEKLNNGMWTKESENELFNAVSRKA